MTTKSATTSGAVHTETVPGARYTALCVPGRERHPPVKAFLDWLRQEVGAKGAP